MALPYRINFIGIICLVKQTDRSYIAAVPDGRQYDDPCSGTRLDAHHPYLIIPLSQMVTSYVPGTVHNKSFVIDLVGVQSLDFADASTPGAIDDTDTVTNKQGYLWSEIDRNFKLKEDDPKNALLKVDLRRGTFTAYRMIGDEQKFHLAVFTEVRIDPDFLGNPKVTIDGNEVEVMKGADLVVANVEPGWLEDVAAGDVAKHFNLYYSMAEPQVPCQPLIVKTPRMTASSHPYLGPNRGLQINCSSTNYP